MDSGKDVIICSDGHKTNDVKIKKESCSSERRCSGIKPELDLDDDLQNQILPSTYSLMEYKNSDLTRDDCAVDMKTEIKEETCWHGSIPPGKFQPELSLLSQSQIRNREVVEERLHESRATTSKNIKEAALIPALYAWHPIPSRIKLKYRSRNVARAIGELRQLQESVNKHISQNQFDIFGRSVASQLKTLQYYKALQVQSEIQALLTNTAIEAFSSSES